MTAAPECDNLLRSAFWRGQVDARPAALLRVGLGLVLIADLVDRLRDFHAFYTAAGVVIPAGSALGFPRWTLFAISDDPRWAMAMFAAGFVVAAALTVGIGTRAASVAAWVFVMSLQHRNSWVNNGGDNVLRLLLFWGMFVDWGARLSLDVRLGRKPTQGTIPALPVRLLQMQLAFIYLVTAAAKQGETWRDGSAVGRVLSSGQWTRGLGPALAEHPSLCVALTYSVLVIEWSLPLLLLCPWRPDRVRAVAVVVGLALHVGIFTTMSVGLFSIVMPVAYLIVLRPSWLDRLLRPVDPGTPRPLGCAPTIALLATVAIVIADFVFRAASDGRDRPPAWSTIVHTTGQDQRWEMFAPDVPRIAIGWTAPAVLADGGSIDLVTTLLPGLDRRQGFLYSRWHKLREVMTLDRPPLSRAMGRYMCRLARVAALPSSVVSFELVQHVRSFDPPKPDVVSVHLRQRCTLTAP